MKMYKNVGRVAAQPATDMGELVESWDLNISNQKIGLVTLIPALSDKDELQRTLFVCLYKV